MSIWKRSGWLALCLLAVLVAFLMQIIGSIVGGFAFNLQEMRKLEAQGMLTQAAIDDVNNRLLTDGMGLCILWGHIMMLVCFAIWFYFGCGRPKLRQAKVAFAPKSLLVILLVAGGMCFCTNFALPVVSLIIPESIMNHYIELMEQAGFGVDTLAIIASVLLAPFGEEFICRGVVFHYAKKMVADMDNRRAAFWIANSVQALMFGILHGNIVQGTYAFFMGLALGYLRHRYNSLAPAIMAHMLINATSSFVWEPIATRLPESNVVYAIGAVIFLAVTFVGLRIGGKAERQTVAVEVAEEA